MARIGARRERAMGGPGQGGHASTVFDYLEAAPLPTPPAAPSGSRTTGPPHRFSWRVSP